MPQELTLEQLIFTAFCMLKGVEGKDFCYYDNNYKWWALRLYTRRN